MSQFSQRPSPGLVLIGNLIDTPHPRTLRVRKNHFMIISPLSGKITHIAQLTDTNTPRMILGEEIFREYVVVWLKGSEFVCPGMIDAHCHAPQYRQIGSANNLPLLDWLNKVTFPNEARCADPTYAQNLYSKMIKRMLRNGTTTVLYFSTIHLQASQILASLCDTLGQRAFIGKLNIDQLSPDYYLETTESSLLSTEAFIKYCNATFIPEKERRGIIFPVITPRFIPTCSEKLLRGLGQLAAKYDCYVQSHAAETVDQISLVRAQFPILERDIAIFDSVGLLRPNKTVLAHCVHLRDTEVRTLVSQKIGIAACPLSNILYSRGVVPVRRYMDMGLRVGLGTDVAGGPQVSMLSAVRGAVLAERTVDFAEIDRTGEGWPEDRECAWDVDFTYGYYLATVGSATALGLGEFLGKFEVGYEFDGLLVETSLSDDEEGFDYFREDPLEILFEKWVNMGDERNIKRVWVQGKEVTIQGNYYPKA